MREDRNGAAESAADITALTLQYYERHAKEFRDGTLDHDVSQNIAALLSHITRPAPLSILDLGCGPGRDLKHFTALGHHAVGVDGAANLAALARSYSGCEVWQQDFLALELPEDRFDGVFANASLFHIPSRSLPHVLLQLRDTLMPGGVLFASNPHGDNQEGWNRGRYGAYYNLETWRSLLLAAGFLELTHYYRPAGLPREQQPWLATVWRSTRQP